MKKDIKNLAQLLTNLSEEQIEKVKGGGIFIEEPIAS